MFICPVCKNELDTKIKKNQTRCKNCRAIFPIENEIYDLYPINNPLEPKNTNLKKLYESAGRKASRSNKNYKEVKRKETTVDLVEGTSVLEIGCAEGWMSKELAHKVENLICADRSMNYLRRAKQQVESATFVRLDVHYLPFKNNYFDCVILTEVLEHTVSPFLTLEEIHRVLKPSGYLVISTPNLMTPIRFFQHLFKKIDLNKANKDGHLNFYDTISLIELLKKSGFKSIQCVTPSIFNRIIRINFVQNIFKKIFWPLGDIIIIKAVKEDIKFWEDLISNYNE